MLADDPAGCYDRRGRRPFPGDRQLVCGKPSVAVLKMIRPAMWLLERYNHPYYVVYTNTPGEIVYEDKYQIAAKADGVLQIDELQPSWSPKETE